MGGAVCSVSVGCHGGERQLHGHLHVACDVDLPALKGLHGFGIIHNDIKPSNICIASSQLDDVKAQKVILVDLGISENILNSEGKLRERNSDLRYFRGTRAFMSKNAFRKIHMRKRDDLCQLVYCLLFMVNGTLPWL